MPLTRPRAPIPRGGSRYFTRLLSQALAPALACLDSSRAHPREASWGALWVHGHYAPVLAPRCHICRSRIPGLRVGLPSARSRRGHRFSRRVGLDPEQITSWVSLLHWVFAGSGPRVALGLVMIARAHCPHAGFNEPLSTLQAPGPCVTDHVAGTTPPRGKPQPRRLLVGTSPHAGSFVSHRPQEPLRLDLRTARRAPDATTDRRAGNAVCPVPRQAKKAG